MTEQQIQKKIINHLSTNAYVVKVVSATKAGVPDILACVEMPKAQVLEMLETRDSLGLFVGIEVKTPTTMKRVTKLQQYNLDLIKSKGGIAFVASDLKTVKGFLGELD